MAIMAAALLTAFVLILILVRPSRVIYVKLLSVPVICIVFILGLVLLSNTAVQAAVNGLKLWSGVVVPSLFPFFVAAEIVNSTGFIRASGILLEPLMRPVFNVPGLGSFALAMGVTSGYPVGAKITCDFRSKGELTKTEAERLLAFTNNSGPLFIVGAVGTGMYGSPQIGLLLLLCHFLACITVGFLFRFYKSDRRTARAKTAKSKALLGKTRRNPFREFKNKLLDGNGIKETNIGAIIGEAVKNSVGTILAIGGFIILFSVVISFLSQTGLISAAANTLEYVLLPLGIEKEITSGVLSGLFEITTGSSLVGRAIEVPAIVQLPAASFIIGWAGLSVHFQVLSIAAKTDVSIRPYLVGKLLQGMISAFYTWICLNCFHADRWMKEPVLGSMHTPAGWLGILGSSLLSLSIIIGISAVLAVNGRHKAYGNPRMKKRR